MPSKILLGFVAVSWLIFIPYWIMLILGIIRISKKKSSEKNDPRLFVIQITTSGANPKSVSNIINEINRYKLDFEYDIWVVAEEHDSYNYPASMTLHVPLKYRTQNNSKYKSRALCYAREYREKKGLTGSDVKIMFLDDDSLPTREYIQAAYHSNYDIAQGIILPRRDFGVSLLSSIQDSIRTSDCIAFCSYFNSIGDARIIHGEGLIARANVEKAIGWDYGDCLAEDLVFGRRATREFRFGFLNEFITIAPPKSIKDFFKQRRRWFWGQVSAFRLVDRSQKIFILVRYLTAILGVFSYFFILIDQIITLEFSSGVRIIFMANTMGWMFYYIIGNYLTLKSVKWLLITVLLSFPAGMIESFALLYGLFSKPTGFDVIRKDLF